MNYIKFLILSLAIASPNIVFAFDPNCLHGIDTIGQIDGESSAREKYLLLGGSKVVAKCLTSIYTITEADRSFLNRCISDDASHRAIYISSFAKGADTFAKGLKDPCSK